MRILFEELGGVILYALWGGGIVALFGEALELVSK